MKCWSKRFVNYLISTIWYNRIVACACVCLGTASVLFFCPALVSAVFWLSCSRLLWQAAHSGGSSTSFSPQSLRWRGGDGPVDISVMTSQSDHEMRPEDDADHGWISVFSRWQFGGCCNSTLQPCLSLIKNVLAKRQVFVLNISWYNTNASISKCFYNNVEELQLKMVMLKYNTSSLLH